MLGKAKERQVIWKSPAIVLSCRWPFSEELVGDVLGDEDEWP
jgi:hypothetical protein